MTPGDVLNNMRRKMGGKTPRAIELAANALPEAEDVGKQATVKTITLAHSEVKQTRVEVGRELAEAILQSHTATLPTGTTMSAISVVRSLRRETYVLCTCD
jgi:hypothetical protein